MRTILSTSYLIHAGALLTSSEGCVRLSVRCVVSRSSLMDLHRTFKQDLDRKRSGVFGNERLGIFMTLLAVPGGLKLLPKFIKNFDIFGLCSQFTFLDGENIFLRRNKLSTASVRNV